MIGNAKRQFTIKGCKTFVGCLKILKLLPSTSGQFCNWIAISTLYQKEYAFLKYNRC